MDKQEIKHWYGAFCPDCEFDGDRIYLDKYHLLVYMEPSDGKVKLVSEIHGAQATYLIGEQDYQTVDKLVAIWADFRELNEDMEGLKWTI